MMTMLILKGGGYGGHSIGAITRLRHHHWTGDNDRVPISNGVCPPDGGLEKKPTAYARATKYLKFLKRQLKREFLMVWVDKDAAGQASQKERES